MLSLYLLFNLAWASTVSVVVDGSSDPEAVAAQLQAELSQLGSDITVLSPAVVGGNDPEAAVREATQTPGVDMVATVGPLSSAASRSVAGEGVPIVAATDLLRGQPKDGLTSLPLTVDIAYALATMERMIGGPVAVVADPLLAPLIQQDRPVLTPSADMVLPEGVIGLAVVPMAGRSDAEQRALFDAWTERGIPTLALLGTLDSGATAAARGEQGTAIFRRLALALVDLEAGRPPRIQTLTMTPHRVTLSAARLRDLGISPPFDVLAEAELVGWAEMWPTLSLEQAVADAIQNNPGIAATRATLAADDTAVAQAWSAWSPQADIGASASLTDRNAGLAFQATERVDASLTGTQLILSDGAVVNVGIQRDLRSAREFELLGAEQDLAYQVTATFIGRLRAQSLIEVRKVDMDRVRLSLDVARERLRLGDGSESDVTRWEAEYASAQAALTGAYIDEISVSITLNQLRGVDAGERFTPGVLGESAPPLVDLLQTPDDVREAGAAISELAQELTPTLAQLDSLLSSQTRAQRLANRAFWMPTLAGQAALNSPLYQTSMQGIEPPSKLYWTAGVSVSLPLFTGGSRRATQREATHDLEALEHQREQARQAVAAQAVEAVNQAFGAALRVVQRDAQVAAVQKSLASSLDAYSAGALTLTTVTEARSSALQAELLATDSRYEAVHRIVDVLYATGSLPTPSNPERPAIFRSRLAETLESQ